MRGPLTLLSATISASSAGRRPRTIPDGRIGVGDAAAERAAGADRVMRDVADDRASRRPSGPSSTGFSNAAWRTPAPMQSLPFSTMQAVEPGHAVDVDQMLRPRQPERHGRHEALPAGQHAAVVVRVLRAAGPAFRAMVLGAWYWNGAGFIGAKHRAGGRICFNAMRPGYPDTAEPLRKAALARAAIRTICCRRQTESRHAPRPSDNRFAARKTCGSSPAAAATATTSACPARPMPMCCARRTPMPASARSTPRRPAPCRACWRC